MMVTAWMELIFFILFILSILLTTSSINKQEFVNSDAPLQYTYHISPYYVILYSTVVEMTQYFVFSLKNLFTNHHQSL